jgi:ribosomal protein L11 methyltransferase
VIRLAVRCRPELAEAVLAQLLELAPGGVEEVDRRDPIPGGGPERPAGGLIEFAIYGSPGELPELPELEATIGPGFVEVESSEIPDDWGDRWRDFHKPAVIAGGRVVVRPSWEPEFTADPAAPGRGSTMEMPEAQAEGKVSVAGAEEAAGIDVVVDPGQAFGTGAHPTTRMCIELLLRLADDGDANGSLVDLGTGSGVLAIAAAKLGWSPVTACDHEPAALEAAAANARANRVDLDLRRINLRTAAPARAETVVANLTAPLLLGIAFRLDFAPRALIASGLLEREAEEVADALERRRLTVCERLVDGEWAALLVRSP